MASTLLAEGKSLPKGSVGNARSVTLPVELSATQREADQEAEKFWFLFLDCFFCRLHNGCSM